MSDYITTYTGKHFEPANPDPELIRIEDIAHALSLLCRGNGHVRTFWSVGQHSISCAREAWARGLPNRMALACLLHDAGECYLSDIPRPLKRELPDCQAREERLLDMIYRKFLGSSLTPEEQAQVREIDDAMLWYDLENLLDEMQFGAIPQLHIDLDYSVRPFGEVEREFLELFRRFSGEELAEPVYLEDIAEALEGCMDGWSQFLDTRTGEIVTVPDNPGLTGMEEDKALWEEIENEDYFLPLPEQYELHEKGIMEDFARICGGSVANRLWRALNSRHPYRQFKDAIRETGVVQKYYDYRFLVFLELAEKWCRRNKVRYRRKGEGE